MSERLLISPGPVTCSKCGAQSDTGGGWMVRATEMGQAALCPTCQATTQHELDKQTEDVNMPGAVLYGAGAALAGAGLWCGLAVVSDYKLGIVAIAVGWFVGKAVVLGAGNKRSVALQVLGGVLALASLVGGEYFIINYFLREAGEFTGWLTLREFITVYPIVLRESGGILDIVFYLIAIYEGAIQPRPLALSA